MPRLVRCALALCLFAAPGAAHGEPRFLQRSALYARLNPLGLSLESDTCLHLPFGGEGLLLGTAHLDLGISTLLSPVMVGLGGSFELEPIAFLALRARVLRVHYLGTFGSITELGSLDADWSPDRLSALEDADRGHTANGTMIDLGAQLRFLVDHFAALADLRWTTMHVEATSPYYEPYADLLLAPDDDFIDTWALAGWIFGTSTLAGLRWELVTGQDADDPRQTLALAGHHELTLGKGAGLAFDVLLGLYLDDAYRSGDPYLACAATFTYAP